MGKLTKAQQGIVRIFQEYDYCRILRFPDITDQKLRYTLQFWNRDDKEPTYTYPNVRTVDALIRKGILIETDNDSFGLNEGEGK